MVPSHRLFRSRLGWTGYRLSQGRKIKKCTECNTTFNGDTWTCPSCQHPPVLRDDFLCFAPDISNVSAFDEKSFSELGDSLDDNFWFPPRNRLITWAFQKYFPNTGSFLEVGCAGAYVLKALADANPEMHVTGADIFTEGLKEAKYRMGDRAALSRPTPRSFPIQKSSTSSAHST